MNPRLRKIGYHLIGVRDGNQLVSPPFPDLEKFKKWMLAKNEFSGETVTSNLHQPAIFYGRYVSVDEIDDESFCDRCGADLQRHLDETPFILKQCSTCSAELKRGSSSKKRYGDR